MSHAAIVDDTNSIMHGERQKTVLATFCDVPACGEIDDICESAEQEAPRRSRRIRTRSMDCDIPVAEIKPMEATPKDTVCSEPRNYPHSSLQLRKSEKTTQQRVSDKRSMTSSCVNDYDQASRQSCNKQSAAKQNKTIAAVNEIVCEDDILSNSAVFSLSLEHLRSNTTDQCKRSECHTRNASSKDLSVTHQRASTKKSSRPKAAAKPVHEDADSGTKKAKLKNPTHKAENSHNKANCQTSEWTEDESKRFHRLFLFLLCFDFNSLDLP